MPNGKQSVKTVFLALLAQPRSVISCKGAEMQRYAVMSLFLVRLAFSWPGCWQLQVSDVM